MPILKSCCCVITLRKGSYASAVYTLVYFGFWSIVRIVHLYRSGDLGLGRDFPIFNILLLWCYSSLIVSSLWVIIGVYKNQRIFLLPWILFMFANIVIEIVKLVGRFKAGELSLLEILIELFTIDFLVLCLNVYCLLCVLSQYQEYTNAGGFAKKKTNTNVVLHHISMVNASTNTIEQGIVPESPHLYPHTNISTISEHVQLHKIPDEDID